MYASLATAILNPVALLSVIMISGCTSNSATVTSTILRTEPEALVQSVAFSPDGKFLAAGTLPSSKGHTVWLWGLNTTRQKESVGITTTAQILTGQTNAANGIAFSPDGQLLAVGGEDRTVRLWKVQQPNSPPIALIAGSATLSHIESVAFSPDGRMLAASRTDGMIDLWHRISGSQHKDGDEDWIGPSLISVTSDAVHAVVFSPDGRLFVAASHDNLIYVWNVIQDQGTINTQVVPKKLSGHSGGVTSVAFSSDSRTLASGSFDQTVRLWDLSKQQPPPSVLGNCQSTIRSVAFIDNSHIAAGCANYEVRVWSRQQPGTPKMTLTGHESWVNSVAFSSNTSLLASGGADATVRLWDISQLIAIPTPAP